MVKVYGLQGKIRHLFSVWCENDQWLNMVAGLRQDALYETKAIQRNENLDEEIIAAVRSGPECHDQVFSLSTVTQGQFAGVEAIGMGFKKKIGSGVQT